MESTPKGPNKRNRRLIVASVGAVALVAAAAAAVSAVLLTRPKSRAGPEQNPDHGTSGAAASAGAGGEASSVGGVKTVPTSSLRPSTDAPTQIPTQIAATGDPTQQPVSYDPTSILPQTTVQPTKTPTTVQPVASPTLEPPQCAAEDERAQECGATNPARPELCCTGLVCNNKASYKCIVPPTPPPPPAVDANPAPVDAAATDPAPTSIVSDGTDVKNQHVADVDEGDDVDDDDPFVFTGRLDYNANLGISVASGLQIKVVAQSGRRIRYTSPSAAQPTSKRCKFHVRPDGAATFDASGSDDDNAEDGDWYYCSNSEVKEFRDEFERCEGGLIDGRCRAGVYCLLLDRDGEVKDYVHRLGGDSLCGANDGVGPDLPSTSTNCQGGVTPWDTWVSCEEVTDGYCWQVDPHGRRPPQRIRAIGRSITDRFDNPSNGWEGMAVDNSDPDCPTFYFSEDRIGGKVRRLRPDCKNQKPGWDMLHDGDIKVDYLELKGGCGGKVGKKKKGTFRWTDDARAAEQVAEECYPYCEGIAVAPSPTGPRLYFVTKHHEFVYVLDHEGVSANEATGGSWEVDITNTNDVLEGEGNFDLYADQITTQVTPNGDFMYHTTDGSATPGVYVHNLGTNVYYTLWQSRNVGKGNDETVGHAISPDGRYIVGALQKDGRVFVLSRKDGGKFRGLDFALARNRHKYIR